MLINFLTSPLKIFTTTKRHFEKVEMRKQVPFDRTVPRLTVSTKESKITGVSTIEDSTIWANVHLLHTWNNNYYPVCDRTFMQEVICIPIHPFNGTLAESATGFSFAISLSLAFESLDSCTPRCNNSFNAYHIVYKPQSSTVCTRLCATRGCLILFVGRQIFEIKFNTFDLNLWRARLTIQHPNVEMQEERRGHSARRKLFQEDDDNESKSGRNSGVEDNIANCFYEEARKNRENVRNELENVIRLNPFYLYIIRFFFSRLYTG